MTTIINCTPHTIKLADAAGEITATFEPSGNLPRVSTTQEVVGIVSGAEIKRTIMGEVTGLPNPVEGVWLLCSTLVAQAAKRSDVIAPDTGPTALRKDGQVIAVKGFQTF
jgi:hypothetical protein